MSPPSQRSAGGRSQAEKAAALRALHAGPGALILPNAWDVASARLVEHAGAAAVATSSAGVAYALGYPDGQRISRGEMLDMVARIAAAVAVPVTADVEGGYGSTPDAAADTARAVIAAGAVGMNLEDTDEAGGLRPLELQVALLRAARAAATTAGVPIVINGRTDVFGVEGLDPAARPAEAVRRANAYLAAGADCAFVPFLARGDVIADLVRRIAGPLNVLLTPSSPDIGALEGLGVRRISVGSGLARLAYARARDATRLLLGRGGGEVLGEAIPYPDMQRLMSGDAG